MKNRIIVDSCCDMTLKMKEEMGISSVPLTMIVDGKDFRDDETLDMDEFMDKMKRSTDRVYSASPSPFLYQEAIENAENAFVVTLSSKLSGSYDNAVLGNQEASQNGKGAAHIFDSKSASAGETLIAIKLHSLIKGGMQKEGIIETVQRFIDEMKTYFVLDCYDNLQKNGRLGKVAGTIVQLLNIKLIMGSDGNGEIALFGKCRGMNKVVQRLVQFIEDSCKDTQSKTIVISHCNNDPLASQLKAAIEERFQFKKVYIIPTGGLSSLYADDKGIVMAF